jgi:hypothetical protein
MWRNEQMNMICHQNIRMNLAAMLLTSLLQFLKIEEVIRIGTENLTAIIAANNDMLRLIGDDKSG